MPRPTQWLPLPTARHRPQLKLALKTRHPPRRGTANAAAAVVEVVIVIVRARVKPVKAPRAKPRPQSRPRSSTRPAQLPLQLSLPSQRLPKPLHLLSLLPQA